MKKSIVLALSIITLAAFFLINIEPTSATSSILDSFNSVYGSTLAKNFSCSICHIGATTKLNPYGKDVSEALGDSLTCPQYDPPSTHTVVKTRGACEGEHDTGLNTPFSSGCIGCHGSNLRGGNAPSCYTCHGQLWSQTSGTNCPDYQPPSSHNDLESEEGCSAYHAPGKSNPYGNGCTDCHGSNLRGESAPSCFTCHGNEWDDDDAPPSVMPTFADPSSTETAFKSIESYDSDGDGYSNKEEIEALTNPGDDTSYPDGGSAIKVKMQSTWDPKWVGQKGTFTLTLIPKTGKLDPKGPVTLTTDSGSVSSTSVKKRAGGSIVVTFQKPLLFALLEQSVAGKQVTIEISGLYDNGNSFATSENVKVKSTWPDVAQGSKTSVNPAKYDAASDLTIVATDSSGSTFDENSSFYLIGAKKLLKAKDFVVNGNKISFTVSAKEFKRLFGTPVSGVDYTVALRGSGSGATGLWYTTANVTVSGSTKPDCYDFSPPSSHTVAQVSGQCIYMHMPGGSTPNASGCNLCHGSDLKGSGMAPSCYLCHAARW